MQTLATYFAPADWTLRAFEFLSTLRRHAAFPELASFDRTILENVGLCDGELEWTLLTNRLALGLARAVADFHKHGVHRDIKPSNSILRHGTDDVVVLIDYGIAKGDSDDTLTDASSVFDPFYASPQQILQVEDATKEDDIYSLGLSIAEISTGLKAYGNLRRGTVLQEKQKGPYDSRELQGIDEDLRALVMSMTSPDRVSRPRIEEVTPVMEKVLQKVRRS